MADEEAAGLIRQLCDDGNMEMAVRLLDMLPEREAAKIISGLGDRPLAAQIAQTMSQLKQTPDE